MLPSEQATLELTQTSCQFLPLIIMIPKAVRSRMLGLAVPACELALPFLFLLLSLQCRSQYRAGRVGWDLGHVVLHYKTSESLTIASASLSPQPTVSLQAEQRCWRAALLPTLGLRQAQDWSGERAGGSGCGGLWGCRSSRGTWREEVHCLAASTSIFLLWAQTVSP